MKFTGHTAACCQVTVLLCVPENGALFTFGERDGGKLGLSAAQMPNHKVPQKVEGICERVLQVACGGGHTLALTGTTTVLTQKVTL